jgi:chromosome segregation ATPase
MEEANRAIKGLVSRLSGNTAEADQATLLSNEMKALSQKLAHIAKLLEQVSPAQPKEHASQVLLNEYVDNLTKLKAVLERAKDALAKRRDQLRKDLEHLNSTKAWVETFRTIQ